MKKILVIGFFALMITNILAQEGGIDKNVRFGLQVSPSINWYKPEGNIIEGDGARAKIGGGLVLEFRLAKVVSIQTGLQIDVKGGKVKYNNGDYLTTLNSNNVSYYHHKLDETIEEYNKGLADPLSYTEFQLNERNYSITYVTLPIAFKMKTSEIGSLTYFGMFGVNNYFRWKAIATDEVQEIVGVSLGTNRSNEKVTITKDVSFYTAALNFGLGAELNISGTTSLTFGLNYLLGFTNTVKKESDFLKRRSVDDLGVPDAEDMPQKLKSNAIALTVGVLF